MVECIKYISRQDTLDYIENEYCMDCEHSDGVLCKDCHYEDCMDIIRAMPASDVQPLSVVAEHIKKRLYETAFNTSEEKARDAIADMAERIDFWIDELKDGEQN